MFDIVDLFVKLNSLGVKYCHFKSNEHLSASFSGDTDFDILVHPLDLEIFGNTLKEYGFVPFKTSKYNSYQNVYDWLGVINGSCNIYHFHVHSGLIIGTPNVKEFTLPLADSIFENTQLTKFGEASIRVINPRFELSLLLIRFLLKLRIRDVFSYFYFRKLLPQDFSIELNWLLKFVTENDLECSCLPCTSIPCSNVIDAIVANDFLKIIKLKINAYHSLKQFRTTNYVESLMIGFRNEYFKRVYPKVFFNKTIPVKRTPQSSGLAVHLIGIDGSGKSTICRSLFQILGKKMDVGLIYFGTGDGPMSLHRKFLTTVKSIFSINSSRDAKAKKNERTPKLSVFGKAKLTIYALSVAFERSNKLAKVIELRSKGFVVICDRYPQISNYGRNDGPLLNPKSFDKGIWRVFSAIEMKLYSKFSDYSSDLLMLCDCSLEHAYFRKPDGDFESLKVKDAEVRQIYHLDKRSLQKKSIDTANSVELTLHEALTGIWSLVTENENRHSDSSVEQ